jgi:hypothetical protein
LALDGSRGERIFIGRSMAMEEEPLMIKGLFNDLTRTLFSSAICLDDLHLNLNPTSEVYDDWWLPMSSSNEPSSFSWS